MSHNDTPKNKSSLLCSIGQLCTTLYIPVQYFFLLCNTEHSCTFLYSTLRFCVALYSTAGYCAALKSLVYSCTAQHSTVQPCIVQHGSDSPVLYSAVQNSSVLFSSVLYFCREFGLSFFGGILFEYFRSSPVRFSFCQGLNSDFRA